MISCGKIFAGFQFQIINPNKEPITDIMKEILTPLCKANNEKIIIKVDPIKPSIPSIKLIELIK